MKLMSDCRRTFHVTYVRERSGGFIVDRSNKNVLFKIMFLILKFLSHEKYIYLSIHEVLRVHVLLVITF